MFLHGIIMIKEGAKAKTNPGQLVFSFKGSLKTIYFNSELIGKFFKITFKIQEIIWYHFGIRGNEGIA